MSNANNKTAAQWADSQMKYFDPIWDGLSYVHDHWPHASPQQLTNLLPAFKGILKSARKFEEKIGPMEWTNLDAWIQRAKDAVNKDCRSIFEQLTALGIDVSELSFDDMEPSKLQQRIGDTPKVRWLSRRWGPNWMLRQEELSNLSTGCANPITLGQDVFTSSLKVRCSKIMRHWEDLKQMHQSGQLERFREAWATVKTEQARVDWLQEQNPNFPTQSHADIRAWLAASESERRCLPRDHFANASLNTEDLAQDDVLPELLLTRATLHPRLFWRLDGRSSRFGLWTGSLRQVSTQGVLMFQSQVENSGDYGVVLKPDVNVSFGCSEEIPGVLFHCIQAQEQTYSVLAMLARQLIRETSLKHSLLPMPRSAASDSLLPILVQSARLDYYGHPTSLDLDFVKGLIDDSLDEAQNALWQLRMDSEFWDRCLRDTPATPLGRVSTFCVAEFDRLGMFDTIKKGLTSLSEYSVVQVSALQDGNEPFNSIVELHQVLLLFIEQQFQLVEIMPWPKDSKIGPMLSSLFGLLKSNDAVLRMISLSAFLRIINREINDPAIQANIPSVLMQFLSDLSILAVCLRETDKHLVVVQDFGHNAQRTNEIAQRVAQEGNPWGRAVRSALGDIRSHTNTMQKLNSFVCDETKDRRLRHRTFWTHIDRSLGESSCAKTSAIWHQMQSEAPLPPSMEETQPQISASSAQLIPSATQLKRSRRRRAQSGNAGSISPEKTMPPSQTLPSIRLEHNLDFWSSLMASSASGDFSWLDFCNAMRGIGYQMRSLGGSGRRFEFSSDYCSKNENLPGTIVFHEPHRWGSKLPHRLAKKLWLRRVQDRCNLEIVQE